MRKGDILGHEFMGEVVETGPKSTLKERPAGGGAVHHCVRLAAITAASTNIRRAITACPLTIRTSPKRVYGQPMSGLFGYSHMTGGYAGGQAEYVRVPFSDVGPIVIPDGIEDDKVLFLSDILPTGWHGGRKC